MPDGDARVGSAHPTMSGGPILLGGDHRSGTTLVSLILDAHPGVVFGPELEFRLPPDLGVHLLQCCDLEIAGDAAIAGDGVTTADPTWQLGIQLVRQCCRFGLDVSELRELVVAELARGARFRDFGERTDLIERIGRARQRASGATRWGFKIQRDIVDAVAYLAVWPDARFVHVIRDGRDVAASHLRSSYDWAYRSVDEAAHGWVEVVGRVPREELGDRLFELSYEEVVDRPEPVLRRLLEHIGLPWSDEVLGHHLVDHDLARRPFDHPSASAATRAIDGRTVGRYGRDLTPTELTRFEAIAGPTLAARGYTLSPEHGTAATRLASATDAALSRSML